MTNIVTKAIDAAAEVVTDWCTAFPEGGHWSCCERHDQAYGSTSSRWRLDRKIASDIALGWCLATHSPADDSPWSAWWRRPVYRLGYVAVGAVATLGVSTFGLWFWWRARPVAAPAKAWAKGRTIQAKARARRAKQAPPWMW